MSSTEDRQARKKARTRPDVVSREYTINLHKRLHRQTFKKKAPRAIRCVLSACGLHAPKPR